MGYGTAFARGPPLRKKLEQIMPGVGAVVPEVGCFSSPSGGKDAAGTTSLGQRLLRVAEGRAVEGLCPEAHPRDGDARGLDAHLRGRGDVRGAADATLARLA